VDNEDSERKDRAPDVAGEERQTLARHRLAVRLGIDPRLAQYLLELHQRIEKLEDRQDSP
jgi:ribosomal protein L31E